MRQSHSLDIPCSIGLTLFTLHIRFSNYFDTQCRNPRSIEWDLRNVKNWSKLNNAKSKSILMQGWSKRSHFIGNRTKLELKHGNSAWNNRFGNFLNVWKKSCSIDFQIIAQYGEWWSARLYRKQNEFLDFLESYSQTL